MCIFIHRHILLRLENSKYKTIFEILSSLRNEKLTAQVPKKPQIILSPYQRATTQIQKPPHRHKIKDQIRVIFKNHSALEYFYTHSYSNISLTTFT